MKQTRLTAAALAAVLLIGTVTACGDTDTEQQGTQAAEVQNTAADTAEPSIYDVLQAQDYGGYEFRILNNISNFAYTNIGEFGQTGESLDDTVYERNNAVADALNITFSISSKEWNETTSIIPNMVAAGDDLYDLYTCDLNHVMVHAMNGYVLNALDIETLSFDNPWWNRSAIDSVSIGDSVYAFFGDLHTGYFESFFPVIFNKSILKELDLDDPYQLVRENRWTVDVMTEMMMQAKSDVDGDGKWTVEDRYPFTMYEDNGSIAYLVAGTSDIIKKNADNLPEWTGLDEQIVSLYTKIAQTFFADKKNNAGYASGQIAGTNLEQYRAMMLVGKALFLVTPLGVIKNLRDVDYEIGVVPMPKFEAEQEHYRTYIYQGANALAVPTTNTDPARTGVILEHMAAYSHETVRSVYFDETLDFKYIQDEDGQEMLDIVFANGVFELSAVYGWGNLANVIMQNMNAGKTDILSKIESVSSKVENDIAETLAAFMEAASN